MFELLINLNILYLKAVQEEDVSKGCYGIMPLIQSAEKIDRTVLDLKQLTPSLVDKKVWVRARLQTSRAKGK